MMSPARKEAKTDMAEELVGVIGGTGVGDALAEQLTDMFVNIYQNTGVCAIGCFDCKRRVFSCRPEGDFRVHCQPGLFFGG